MRPGTSFSQDTQLTLKPMAIIINLNYSVSTNFRLELIETSARGIDFSDSGRESQQGGLSEERRRDHGSNLARMSPKVP